MIHIHQPLSLSLSSMQRKKRKLINHYKELPTNFMLNTKTKCIREMNLKCLSSSPSFMAQFRPTRKLLKGHQRVESFFLII